MRTKKSSDQIHTSTFSATIRQMRQEHPEQVLNFLKKFKACFERAVDEGLEDPEQTSLLELNYDQKSAPSNG